MDEVGRIFRPGVDLYVLEPFYGGVFNKVIRVLNDERVVRAAAQACTFPSATTSYLSFPDVLP